MSLLLGTVVAEPIQIQASSLMDILKQVKHYLTLQTSITLSENEHSFTLTSARKLFSAECNNKNQFVIPKNFGYLFTHYQKIYVDNEEDLEFFDVCYECLMVLKEYLPSEVDIRVEIMEEMDGGECVGDSELRLADFVENFENQKNEQFLRRINSNFKSLISRSESFSTHDVQNILYMAEHFYFYKNKLAALKHLAHNDHILKQVFAQIGTSALNFMKELAMDQDFRPYCEKVIEKVAVPKEILMNANQPHDEDQSLFQGSQNHSNLKSAQNDQESDFIHESQSKSHFMSQKQLRLQKGKPSSSKVVQKERSPLKLSSKQNMNLNRQPHVASKEDQLKNLSVKSLLFQLRESQSLKRISMLVEAASEMKIGDQKYEVKVQRQIQNICKRFLKQSYLDRYEKNQERQKQKSQLMDESFIPTEEQVEEVSKFYQSLLSYFSKKDPSLKLGKTQLENASDKKSNMPKQTTESTSKYRLLLQQICSKIENKYYLQ